MVANLHKEKKASASTVRATDSMATKGVGEQASVVHSQNIEQAVEVELHMGIQFVLEIGGGRRGRLRNLVRDPDCGGRRLQ